MSLRSSHVLSVRSSVVQVRTEVRTGKFVRTSAVSLAIVEKCVEKAAK